MPVAKGRMENLKIDIGADKMNPSVYGKIVLSLENCLLPKEKFDKSPSIKDGLDEETEDDLRIMGCELIQTAGILLKLPQVAMATGQVLFQRFYFCKSFVRHPMDITAMGCICLASKIEEAPRRIRDVINVFHHVRQIRCQKPITPLILDQQYISLKTQVIKSERRVLKELGFCVHVKHPHKLIVCYLQVLSLEKNHALMQQAWNFMNDSLRTDVFLRHSPEAVAGACIYLTARKLRITLPKNPTWFSIFGIKEEDVVDISKRIMRLYRRPKIDPEALESKVEQLKKIYEEEREKIRNNAISASGNNTPNNNNVNNENNTQNIPPRSPRGNHLKRSSNTPDNSPKSKKSKKSSRKYTPSPEPVKSKKSHKHKYISRSPSPSEIKKSDYRSKGSRDYRIVDSGSEEEGNARSRPSSYNYWKKYYGH